MDRSLQLIGPLARAFHLKALSGLRDVAPANLAALALQAHEHSFARGATLWRAGERVERVHIVVDGRVRVRGGEYGDEVVGPERAIGMLSLLARDEKGLDAVAETATQTLALRADDLFSAFEDEFSILYSQIRDLAAQTFQLRRRTPAGTYLKGASPPSDVPTGDIDFVQRLLFLRQDVFPTANVDALIMMAQRMRTARFEPGTTLWQIGAQSGFLYAILSGRTRCTMEDGTQFTCGPGYPLGNLESLCNAPRWYGAVADASVTAFRIDVDAFLDTFEQHPEMAIDYVSGRASDLITRLAEMREANSTVAA